MRIKISNISERERERERERRKSGARFNPKNFIFFIENKSPLLI